MDISSRPSYVEASPEASLSAAQAFVAKCRHHVSHLPEHRRLVEPVITPRFVPTCSDELLEGLGTLSHTENIRVQSHMAEAHDQMEWVKRERGIEDINVFDRVSPLKILHIVTDARTPYFLPSAAQAIDNTDRTGPLHVSRHTILFSSPSQRHQYRSLSAIKRVFFC